MKQNRQNMKILRRYDRLRDNEKSIERMKQIVDEIVTAENWDNIECQNDLKVELTKLIDEIYNIKI